MVRARYFDGRSAAGHDISLERDGADWLLHGSDWTLRWPQSEVSLSERLGDTPRLLRHASGGHCEVLDHAGLGALLGAQPGWLERAHHQKRWVLLALLLIPAFFGLSYRYLLPWTAERVALSLPVNVLQTLGGASLDTLDHTVLEPSKLPVSRQQAILAAFSQLAGRADTPYHIVFRRSDALGANAFALPDGSIVLLDGLVALSNDDHEVAAVLAHELGHVERRHAARLLLQDSVTGLVLAWYAGDISTLLSAAPGLLLQARYSRDMETEADDYAARLLRHHGWSPCLLGSMLEKLEKTTPAAAKGSSPGFLASHPASSDRMQRLCPKPAD